VVTLHFNSVMHAAVFILGLIGGNFPQKSQTPPLPPEFLSENYSAHLQKYQKCPQIQSQTV